MGHTCFVHARNDRRSIRHATTQVVAGVVGKSYLEKLLFRMHLCCSWSSFECSGTTRRNERVNEASSEWDVESSEFAKSTEKTIFVNKKDDLLLASLIMTV
ncbi:hypothetical protein TcYC6_0110970 [Trypanosoma cruzi]|nr:hypothetical protein TcYC6_0110970 [Trypanosoma cruzi]